MSNNQKMGEATRAIELEEKHPRFLEKGSILCMTEDGVAHIVHADNKKKKRRRSMPSERKKAPIEKEDMLHDHDESTKVPSYKGALVAIPLRVRQAPMAAKLLPKEEDLVNVPLVYAESITPFLSLTQKEQDLKKFVKEEEPGEPVKEEEHGEPIQKKRSFEARPSSLFDKNSSDYDWLPENWIVEERVRVDGRIDKFYYAPSGEMMRSKLTAFAFMKERGIEVNESAMKRKRQRRVKEEVSNAEQRSDQE